MELKSSDIFAVEEADVDTKNRFVLNYKPGETVKHSLVLIEGEIKVISKEIPCEISTNRRQLEGLKEDKSLSKFEPTEILVVHKETCSCWPVAERKFKAFLKLDKGVNLVKIECHVLNIQEEMSIYYEEQANQKRFVRVVYIKCSDSDGSFDSPDNANNSLEAALEKLRFNVLLLQTFMAVEMKRHGFGDQTFKLEENDSGEVVVHVFTSKLTTKQAHQMNGDELYSWFSSELKSSSLNDPNCKFLAFMSCSHYDPPEEIDLKELSQYIKAHTALGGGQLGLIGTAGLHTWGSGVGDLVRCFTDETKIDRTKLFDDSAGRGTFWANYSTTLGAALHELGHCFDLMHMPQGIMGRGFDDMNHFVLATSSSLHHCLLPAVTSDVSSVITKAMGMFADHRAHWFRSSAVLLHHHKWLRPTSLTENSKPSFQLNWSRDIIGPIGNGGGGQQKQSYFEDVASWNERGVTPSGYIVYHSEFVNALVPFAGSSGEVGKDSPVYGKIDESYKIGKFFLEKDEYITSIELRAGAWIDGIRFHTNIKSSIWFGGRGGEWYRIEPSQGEYIDGVFGTFGEFVGSLGIKLRKRNSSLELNSTPLIKSDNGLALVELRHRDELINFWEFVECSLYEFRLPLSWLQGDASGMSLMAVDIEGNILRSSFVGYEEFRKRNLDRKMNEDI